MSSLQSLRQAIISNHLDSEDQVLKRLEGAEPLNAEIRRKITRRAVDLVEAIRSDNAPGLMEVFLAEYGLSTDEGVALMCLAEALLRVPDPDTVDALIEDKIAPSAWGAHLGRSSSSLVNASTWALMLTGKVLTDEAGDGVAVTLRRAVKRLGEPVIRKAVSQAIREMGHQFVLGRTIDEAVRRGVKPGKLGYRFSYDMLGEAAVTAADARSYFDAYSAAIRDLAQASTSQDVRENPGISVKLSALHPRYEFGQRERVLRELVASTRTLARQAAKAGMGFNIDAEEADRLDLSLDVIEAVLRDPDLAGWDGFGVVVQAYSKSAGSVLDWLYALSKSLDRRIMVRLVKGAYWDSEIKRAQVEGLADFPVFTRKAATDASYILCARKLLGMSDRIYAQFATHNAHSVAAILEMAPDRRGFEFQRLQGMGETLHRLVLAREGTRCRIYAPVGTHRDLLAYLVRRLLENGANSSFVNQIVDEDVAPEQVASDPFLVVEDAKAAPAGAVVLARDMYGMRRNSRGWDVSDRGDIEEIEAARAPFLNVKWQAAPLIAVEATEGEIIEVVNPANRSDVVGQVHMAGELDVEAALNSARDWSDVTAKTRGEILRRVADLYEENFAESFAILAREAGKTIADAVSELREAVDFLRYYADQGLTVEGGAPCGVVTCISPWNFPLAIFSGQVAAALAAGNAVLAKPAEATSIIAWRAVEMFHRAGVPRDVLQFLPGRGALIGARLSGDRRVAGVCFTGSTATAQAINRAMAEGGALGAPLIAETGGLNAMIVDSTALPEQAIRDVIAGAFQSAGQRCSATRMLYLQEDIAEPFLNMLFGAMDELVVGDPWRIETDLGPVIDVAAKAGIEAHIAVARAQGRVMKRVVVPEAGSFVAPSVLRVSGIGDLEREVFGPVLHVATYAAHELDDVVDAINATGYGLTFGMHSRIDDRIEQVTSRLNVGNIYINRNQIGAVVGSQPFGGEGMSGTGPKAGGPSYVARFRRVEPVNGGSAGGRVAAFDDVQAALDRARKPRAECLFVNSLPGPTGESNQLSTFGRGTVLCLGPTREVALEQRKIARANGCETVVVAEDSNLGDRLDYRQLGTLSGFDLVALWAAPEDLRAAHIALAGRDGLIIGLASGLDLAAKCRLERHVCIDTTAAGGNARLLAEVG